MYNLISGLLSKTENNNDKLEIQQGTCYLFSSNYPIRRYICLCSFKNILKSISCLELLKNCAEAINTIANIVKLYKTHNNFRNQIFVLSSVFRILCLYIQ